MEANTLAVHLNGIAVDHRGDAGRVKGRKRGRLYCRLPLTGAASITPSYTVSPCISQYSYLKH